MPTWAAPDGIGWVHDAEAGRTALLGEESYR